jgi:hypothetical protein
VNGRWRWMLIGTALSLAVVLAFVYPHLMLSPGPLLPAHRALASDCFACHAPLHGASAERCMSCHALPEIGLRTTKGVLIKPLPTAAATRPKVPFHQQLTEQNCLACHSDHARAKLAPRSHQPFSHALLRVETRARCEACHKAADDALHRQIVGNCSQCHTPGAWKPASFAHNKFFVLDKQHNASCITCHAGADYSKFTCYGCHEHTPANVSRKHREEGIQNFDNCVECHRSAEGEGEGREGRDGD